MKIGILLFVLVLFSGFCFAYVPDDLIWDGYINIYFDKPSFSIDENVTGRIVITNDEYYPIVGQRIVLQVGTGQYGYPSQDAADNIVREEQIVDLYALPRETKYVNFDLGKLASGNYHLDAYSWILKSKFIGSSSIFWGPQTKNFIVEGNSSREEIFIDRRRTVFGDNVIGPIGYPLKAGDKITGQVLIKNNSSSTKSNLKLLVSVCDWATVFCENLEEKEFQVPTITSAGETIVNVSVDSPTIPSAYAINLKLVDGKETKSIYKSRVIIEGGTAKIRKAYLDGLGENNYSVGVFIAGSPDHFNNPNFENFELEMEVYNNTSQQKETKSIQKIETGEILFNEFNITSNEFSSICVRVKKSSVVYDEECFSVPLTELKEEYKVRNPNIIDVEWSYNTDKEELSVILNKDIIDSRLRILKGNSVLYNEDITGNNQITKKYFLAKDNYTLVVDDFDAKRQIVKYLNLGEEIYASENYDGLVKCPHTVCEAGYVCDSNPYETVDGACCTTECVPAVNQTNDLFKLIPLILILAAIIFVAAIVIFGKAIGELKK